VIVALVVASAWGQASPSVADLLQMLRAGGYVIVFRHGATYPDQADTDPLNLGNIAQQRQLNDKGRADAKVVGEAFKGAGVPVGKSYSTRWARTGSRSAREKRPSAGPSPLPRCESRLTLTARSPIAAVGVITVRL